VNAPPSPTLEARRAQMFPVLAARSRACTASEGRAASPMARRCSKHDARPRDYEVVEDLNVHQG